MQIISWNVNGIRAVFKKGFLKWLKNSQADIVCLQEIKAQKEQIPEELFGLKDYNFYLNTAVKKGYSGVAVFTKRKPKEIESKLGHKRFDEEGRFLGLFYDDFVLINLYLPHGSREKINLAYKLEVYDVFLNYLKKIKSGKVVLIGDFNVAHQEIDLARPEHNKNNIMFTSEERGRIDRVLETGFIDSFRKFNKNFGNYTWWPYYANARERNLGWRIDYAFVSKSLSKKLKKAFILKNIGGSDHCPLGIEI